MDISFYVIMIILGIPFALWMEYLVGDEKKKQEIRESFTPKGIKESFSGLTALARLFFGVIALIGLFVLFLWFIKIVWTNLPT